MIRRLAFVLLVAAILPAGVARATVFDHDDDGDVDFYDAQDFATCLVGPGGAAGEDCTAFHDGDSDLDVDLADVAALQAAFTDASPARIHELTFTGTYFHAIKIDCPSGSCSSYSTPHWRDVNLDGDAEDSGENQFPVAYQRNKPVRLSGVRFDGAGIDPEVPNVPVRGTGPDGLVFEGTATLSGSELVVSGYLDSSSSLPNTVKYYDTFDIAWEVALDGVTYVPAGISRNTMYVTYAAPTGDQLESYYYISTPAASGLSSSQDIIDAIWAEFADLEVYNAYGERLGYYRGILCASYCTYYSAAELVYYTNSQCGGWADLLMECFNVQGISGSQFITIQPRGTPYLPVDCGSWPASAAGFIVNNYQYMLGDTSGCASYPFRLNDPCGYYSAWSPATCVDAIGLPGQDNDNPASWFARHFIVKINSRYYDPSYGAGPFEGTTEQACSTWEASAISGYFGTATSSPQRLGVRRDSPQVRETSFSE